MQVQDSSSNLATSVSNLPTALLFSLQTIWLYPSYARLEFYDFCRHFVRLLSDF